MAQWALASSSTPKGYFSIPGQVAYLGDGFNPWLGHIGEASSWRFSLLLPLSLKSVETYPWVRIKNETENNMLIVCYREESDEYIDIGALNGIFVLGRSMGFIGELVVIVLRVF